MQKVWSVLGTLVFLVIGPGTIGVLVPWLITGGRTAPPFLGSPATLALGAALLSAGLLILLESFGRFALQGGGTPAPIFPTRQLVVDGFYRFMRNPMYVAVLCIVLGQGLLFASPLVLLYAVVLAAAFHAFILLYEEPTLRKVHGEAYDAYCVEVGRWLPRFGGKRSSDAPA